MLDVNKFVVLFIRHHYLLGMGIALIMFSDFTPNSNECSPQFVIKKHRRVISTAC